MPRISSIPRLAKAPRLTISLGATIVLAFSASAASAQEAASPPVHSPAHATVYRVQHAPDCLCRALGRNFEVGQTACLRAPDGLRLAECGMVLNNTSWLFTTKPCPES